MAFNITKPSMNDADWPTFAANIRENVRAIVAGDTGVFQKSIGISSANSFNLALEDTATANLGVGGAIQFRGKYTSAGAYSEFATVRGIKENATDSNNAGALLFLTRTSGGAITERMRIASDGKVGIMVTPVEAFHVAGSCRVDGNNVYVCGPNSSSVGFSIRNSSATQHWLIYENVGGAGEQTELNFRNMVSSRTDIILGTDGGVTIGAVSGNALQITAAKNVVIGSAALATNATNGFLYLYTCAGVPTGAPTTFTGRVPFIYDTTNNHLYVYNGGWKKTAVFA